MPFSVNGLTNGTEGSTYANAVVVVEDACSGNGDARFALPFGSPQVPSPEIKPSLNLKLKRKSRDLRQVT
jgi:hypothetical protein